MLRLWGIATAPVEPRNDTVAEGDLGEGLRREQAPALQWRERGDLLRGSASCRKGHLGRTDLRA